jgi:hypothetical protein
LGVGDDRAVGLHKPFVLSDEAAQVRTADLLLSLEQDSDIAWRRSLGSKPRFKRLYVGEQLPLVVGSTPAIKVTLGDLGRKRRVTPSRFRLYGLNVVMSVDQNRRPIWRNVDPSANDRVPTGLDDPGCINPDLAEMRSKPVRTPANVDFGSGIRTHGRDPDKLLEFANKPRVR